MRCDARAQHRTRRQRPVGQVGQRVDRLPQGVAGAVGEAAGDRPGADDDASFRPNALDGRVVELIAVDRIGHHAAVLAHAWHRQPDQQGHRRFVLAAEAPAQVGRRAAAVLYMAATAGARDEMRPQPVARGGRGRSLHPVATEEGVADREAGALLVVERGEREGEGVAAGGGHGGGATGLLAQRVFDLGGLQPAQAADTGNDETDRGYRPYPGQGGPG